MFAGSFLTIGMHQLSDHRIDTSKTTGTIVNGGSCTKGGDTPAKVVYSVGGQSYATTTGDRCLTVGGRITVHYKPSDPAHADFQATPVTNGLGAVAVGGLLIATGAFITMGMFRPRGRWVHRGRWAQHG